MFWKTFSSTSDSSRDRHVVMGRMCASLGHWTWGVLLLCLWIVVLPGCDKTRQVVSDRDTPSRTLPQDPHLPNISDPRFQSTMPKPPASSRGQVPVTLRVSRLDFEMGQSLDKALRHAIPATTPTQTAILKDNGLRMMLLPLSEFEDFAKELGQPLNVWRTNLHMSYDGTPLATTPQIAQKVSVDIVDQQLTETYTTNEGWFRLMLSVQQTKLGSVSINFIPQHYLPKTSVFVRSAMDKIWDGTLFDRLKTQVDLPGTHLLVVCRTEHPTLEEYRATHNPGLFDPEPGKDATIKPNHSMGDLLLTYDHWGHPTQMVYVFARVKNGL